jgi:hypothetical protein
VPTTIWWLARAFLHVLLLFRISRNGNVYVRATGQVSNVRLRLIPRLVNVHVRLIGEYSSVLLQLAGRQRSVPLQLVGRTGNIRLRPIGRSGKVPNPVGGQTSLQGYHIRRMTTFADGKEHIGVKSASKVVSPLLKCFPRTRRVQKFADAKVSQ